MAFYCCRTLLSLMLVLITGFSLLVPTLSAEAWSSRTIDLQALDNFLREEVSANRIPGMAVAVVQDDQILFSKGYGEAAPGVPVTDQTQFYIGSVAKSFTALAAMQLVDQGKLDLDSPVQHYLPWFQVADSEASEIITVRHLLNHTSGLSEKGDPNATVYTASLEEQARLLKDARLTAPVGTQFQYFNQNYRLVGLLIEQVSGQSYLEYLQANIFDPLGMQQSTADPAKAARLAQGYSRVFGFPLPQSQRFIPGALPSGYLISTAGDMGKFLLAQMNNQQADGSPLLSQQALTTMRSEPAGLRTGYGMGWLVMEDGNMLAHGGALEYFQTFIAFRPKEKLGFVVLYNQNGLENMMLENDSVRAGLLNLLNGQIPRRAAYGWLGWLLLGLAAADLLNHARLLRALPGWALSASVKNRSGLWIKVLVGILFPLFIIFGLPLLVKAIQGGTPTWAEPFRLMPDLITWLLLGMSLNLIRSLMGALLLLRQRRSAAA